MYKVLYRKWRPQTFDDVYGQQQVTVTLKNQIKNNRFGHAYLFTGSRGTGKTTCAKIFAKAVNCLNPQDGNPCCECENCKLAENSNFFDIVEMDAASNRGIESIRSLIDEVSFTPSKGKYRVYIIDEVHMLTTEAFNALLKTLEEPPQHVIFILATTEIDKIAATILSRCQRFDFNHINAADICERLMYVSRHENIELDSDAATLIASAADGALRDALSLLDRCIGLSNKIDINIAREAAGLARKDYIVNLVNSCINKNCAAALEIINKLYNDSKSMSALCNELISRFRVLMLIKTVSKPQEIAVLPNDEFEVAKEQAAYLSLEDIVYTMDILFSAGEKMIRGLNNRTELETALVRLCSPELDASNDALLTRISALERAIKHGVISVKTNNTLSDNSDLSEKNEAQQQTPVVNIDTSPALQSSYTAVSAITRPISEHNESNTEIETSIKKSDVTEKTKVSLEDLRNKAVPLKMWPEVIEEIGKYSKAISSALKGSTAYTSGNYLLIDTDNKIAYDLLKNSAQKDKIRNAVFEMTGKRYNMGPYRKREEAELKDDPLLNFIAEAKKNGIKIDNF